MDFYLFTKNMGKNINENITKRLNHKYSQKHLDHAKQFARDAIETTSKRPTQKISKK